MSAAPGLGWANAVPDAAATVDLTIGQTKLAFTGFGYHDMNWGVQPLMTHLAGWHWGHGRLGPYSLVWFDSVARDGRVHASVYAAKDGEIVAASCAPRHRLVFDTSSKGYGVRLDLGRAEALLVYVSVAETVLGTPSSVYSRAVGALTGVLIGGPSGGAALTGKALFDQFKLTG